MTCEKCGSETHRDDAMNLRCNDCEHLVRQCICKNTTIVDLTDWKKVLDAAANETGGSMHIEM